MVGIDFWTGSPVWRIDQRSFLGILSDGGYAQYATLRREAVLSIPNDMDPAQAAPLLCAGVTTFSMYAGLTKTTLVLTMPFMQTPSGT